MTGNRTLDACGNASVSAPYWPHPLFGSGREMGAESGGRILPGISLDVYTHAFDKTKREAQEKPGKAIEL